MAGEYQISARTASNATIYVEIALVSSSFVGSDGDDDYEVALFKKVNADAPFQLIIIRI
jgi:hypothetical protein